jgi:hypothetical protein
MVQAVMALEALPSWLLVYWYVHLRFPGLHPWKRQHYSLVNWYYGRTAATVQADLLLWIALSAAAIALRIIL